MRARQNKERGGEERQKDTKRKIECGQSGIPNHHTTAQSFFDTLQQRKK